MYPILYDVCNNCRLTKNTSDVSCVNNQTVQWIYNVFHECVNNPKEEVGFILGLVSICCWICASVPQLYENYKTKKVEEAIAFMFLLLWLFGDLSNLIGCLLTGQLPIQIITAVYYVGMDIIMISQYGYYRMINKSRARADQNASVNNSASRHIVPCCFLMAMLPLSLLGKSFGPESTSNVEHRRIGRTLLAEDLRHGGHILPTDPEDIAGYAIGCISSLLYLGSRLPQIIKNQRRRKTEGVSINLFILAVAGNALYGSSVLLQDPDPGKTYGQFIMQHLPWLIGSLGTMTLDFIALTQILYFNPPCRKIKESEEDTEHLIA